MATATVTETQILDMLDKYFQAPNISGWDFSDDSKILEFARAMYEEGYNKGYDDSKSSSFKGFHNCLDD